MPASTDLKKAAILLVDDERQTLKYFERAFAEEFDVLTAGSVDEAESILELHPERVGVVISDQRMPGRTGVTLLGIVREKYPSVIRVLTTAYADLGEAIDAVNSGQIFRYIVKPWDFDQLRQELNLALLVFNLQRERELLIGEKLNVRLRQRAANRGRDILVIASSIVELRNGRAGALSFLRDAHLSAPRTQSLTLMNKLELWSNIEAETAVMGNLASEVGTRLQLLRRSDWRQSLGPVSVEEVLREAAAGTLDASKRPVGRLLEFTGSRGSIITSRERLQLLCAALLSYVVSSAAPNTKIDAAIDTLADGVIVKLAVTERGGGAAHLIFDEPSSMSEASGLLVVYLLCSDMGATIHVDRASPIGLIYELRFPLAPPASFDEPHHTLTWANGAFESLEQW